MPDRDLEDLLLSLLNEPELRVLFDRLGLGSGLPGAGVSLEALAHEAAALLERKGRVDAELFAALAEGRRGAALARVRAAAAARGVALAVVEEKAAAGKGGAAGTRSAGSSGEKAETRVARSPLADEDPRLADLQDLIAKRQIVVICGAGVSLSATGGAAVAGWLGLLRDGLERCRSFAGTDEKWLRLQRQLLDDGEVADWIHVAGRITDKLGGTGGGEFRRWLRESVGSLNPCDPSLPQAIAALGCPIATTSYDHLLESVTGLPPVSWDEKSEVERLLRGDEPGVLHLHGHWRRPESVVLGLESYLSVRDDGHASAVRTTLRTGHSLLFIGCGDTTEDPNIGAWLDWSGLVFAGSEYRSYRLELDGKVAETQKKHPPEQRIFALGYGPYHGDLAAFVQGLR